MISRLSEHECSLIAGGQGKKDLDAVAAEVFEKVLPVITSAISSAQSDKPSDILAVKPDEVYANLIEKNRNVNGVIE